MTEDERYDRQRRLREIGARGQLRIERSSATVTAGPGTEVACAYLAGAGVSRVTIGGADAAPVANAAWFQFSGPRAVARGATLSLQHLLASIESE